MLRSFYFCWNSTVFFLSWKKIRCVWKLENAEKFLFLLKFYCLFSLLKKNTVCVETGKCWEVFISFEILLSSLLEKNTPVCVETGTSREISVLLKFQSFFSFSCVICFETMMVLVLWEKTRSIANTRDTCLRNSTVGLCGNKFLCLEFSIWFICYFRE